MTDQQLPSEDIPASNLPAKRQPDAPRGLQQENTYTQNARGRITVLPFSLGLIALGGLLLIQEQIEGFDVTPIVAGVILTATLVLTNLFRFFASGRQERGLFFLALLMMAFGGVLAVINILTLDIDTWYPLLFFGIAAASLGTFIFERQHERALVGLAVLCSIAGIAGLSTSQDILEQDILDQAADYFPLIIAIIGVTLIPLALRRDE